jgi:hypothetical protein
MNILCIEPVWPQETHNRTLLFGSTPIKHVCHFDYWNQPLNMRMRIWYVDCHEAELCCYLVIHIENLLDPLQQFYGHLWPIYLLCLIHVANETGFGLNVKLVFCAKSTLLLAMVKCIVIAIKSILLSNSLWTKHLSKSERGKICLYNHGGKRISESELQHIICSLKEICWRRIWQFLWIVSIDNMAYWWNREGIGHTAQLPPCHCEQHSVCLWVTHHLRLPKLDTVSVGTNTLNMSGR